MNTLHFEKISKYDREREPVTVSIPFAEGILPESWGIAILDGDRTVPSQTRVLSRWPDGSAKWLIAHLQPDLPGNSDKVLHFEVVEDMPVRPGGLAIAESDNGIRIETGPLSFTIPRKGFPVLGGIEFEGKESPLGENLDGFSLRVDDRRLSSTESELTLEIEEAGPLVAAINVSGKHLDASGNGYIDLAGRITAYAGKPYIEIEHRFIHRELEEKVYLEELRWDLRPAGKAAEVALGEGYYKADIKRGRGPFETLVDGERIVYQAFEHFVDSFYADFWADWRSAQGGFALSIYQSHQNFPKKLAVDADGITCSLYPAEVTPAPVYRGMAKTHRLLLHFHGPDTPLSEISARSLQFQIPDRPALSREWFRKNNPWGLEYFPDRMPARLITWLMRLHDGRPKALGMLHFGDAPDAPYTDQGRGRGRQVWVNNEYDRPHACLLFHGLTGLRRALDSSLVSARHWLDVDFCHRSDNAFHDGGLLVHSAYHVTAGVTPSHEWVDGLLDYYYLTGRREGLEAARSVAANIMRHAATPVFRREGETSTRENGWALRAMVAMYLATGEESYREEARRIADLFVRWHGRYGSLLAPYTDHSMPRVVFMNSITGNSLAHYLLLEDREEIRRLIRQITDDLIAHCLNPDGIFYYKELPSLRTGSCPTPHVMELLAHAYRISGDQKYLGIANRQFAARMDVPIAAKDSGPKRLDESGAVIRGNGDGRAFAYTYTSLLLFASAAAPLGLLDWYEYPS
jgi:hypothetical protein